MLGGVRVGAGAHPVPLGEVGRGRPRLLAVQPPAFAVARRPQLHRGGIGTGVGLAVAHGELDLVAQDLGQELLLQPVVPVGQDRLADDPHALADLWAAPTGQGLVEEVLVHPVALLASPLLGPGDPEPAAVADLAHECPLLRRVDDLGHVLPRDVEHLGIVVLVEKALDLVPEGDLLGGELEVQCRSLGRVAPASAGATQNLIHHQSIGPAPGPVGRTGGEPALQAGLATVLGRDTSSGQNAGLLVDAWLVAVPGHVAP